MAPTYPSCHPERILLATRLMFLGDTQMTDVQTLKIKLLKSKESDKKHENGLAYK
jgi:hypothetical protein